jgi:hypothetical protein
MAATARGDLLALSDAAMQDLVARVVQEMVSRMSASDGRLRVVSSKDAISPTEAMVFASALLKAEDLAVFELGLWQSWGIGEQQL